MTSLSDYASSSRAGAVVFTATATAKTVLAGTILVGAILGSVGAGVADEFAGTTRRGSTDRCAVFGPDFAAVEGSDACVRVGGHVRVRLGANAGLTPNDGWRSGGAASATLRSDTPAATHLRIQGGLEYPDPFH